MRPTSRHRNEIRCFCRMKPLLAVCGVDTVTREPFVWVKVYKQGRIYGEVIVENGAVVRLRCRECSRWHTVRTEKKELVVSDEPLPSTLQPNPA